MDAEQILLSMQDMHELTLKNIARNCHVDIAEMALQMAIERIVRYNSNRAEVDERYCLQDVEDNPLDDINFQ